MKTVSRWVLLMAFLALGSISRAAVYTEVRDQVLKFSAEGSHARALALLRGVTTNDLSRADHREFVFRLNDSLWRAQGDNLRNEETEGALRALDAAFPQQAVDEDRDRSWAEAQESLGDLHRRRGDPWDWQTTRYGNALNWWAAQSDLDPARERYLAMIWKLERPAGIRARTWYQRNSIPYEWVQNAVVIAKNPADIAHARLLRALALRNFGPPDERALYLVEDDFLAAINAGKGNDWYDDALNQYAQWLETSGRLVLPKSGGWRREPDAPRALEIYRRIVSEFANGESGIRNYAEQRITEILREEVVPLVEGVFLPGGDTTFSVHWRNTKNVRYTLTPIELTKAVNISNPEKVGDWLASIEVEAAAPAVSGEFSTGDDGSHNPGSTNVMLKAKPGPGAYLLQVTGDTAKNRALLLVSDSAVTVRASGKKALVWFTDSTTGKPVAEARVKMWHQFYQNGSNKLRPYERETDSNGVAEFEIGAFGGQVFVAAGSGERQAHAATWLGGWNPEPDGWKIYAVTDRPAYRPEDTVHWKFTARRRESGAYRTPANVSIYYEIADHRSTVLTNGTVKLNTFGSGWGSLPLSTNMALGECRITFWTDPKKVLQLGEARLFRIEEYKLPEFAVKVLTPEEEVQGVKRRKAFKLGDAVEIEIQSDYYFGGPVANAAVEVMVYRRSWSPIVPKPYEYPWFYESEERWQFRGHGEQEVRRETLKTDGLGRAKLVVQSDASGGDMEYRVEARVTDASRREVRGEGSVRVTRQRYFATARALNRLPQPGDNTRVEFRTTDANNQPVAVAGQVKIVRQTWNEIWIDPQGREVGGEELARLKRESAVWPPKAPENGRAWRLKFRGYERAEVKTEAVSTGTNGLAELGFKPDREGYFTFEWSSPGNATAPPPPDNRPRPYEPEVTAQAAVWVCTPGSRSIGYVRESGVEIVVDRETFRTGNRVPIMLTVDSPDRWILFIVDMGDSFSHQVLHIPGTARLVELTLDERHVPNVWLTAAGVWNQQTFTDSKEVVVPPVANFLTIGVTPDVENKQPRDGGRFVITTRDYDGKPVAAEVSFGVIDESVFQIGDDLAGDPRQFFFGEKRPHAVQFVNSVMIQRHFRFDAEARLQQEMEQAVEALQASQSGLSELRDAPAATRAMSALGAPVRLSLGGAAKMARAELASADNAPSARFMFSAMDAKVAAAPGSAPAEPLEPAVVVRSDFRNTAFWQPDIATTADGTASVSVQYPDSTTRWIATARGATAANQFGIGTNAVRTSLPLIVRLQTPRFLVAGDLAVITSVIVNNTDEPAVVKSLLEVSGAEITGGWKDGQPVKVERPATVTVPAHGEFTDTWTLSVSRSGPVVLTASARGAKHADAMERTITAFEHGIDKFVATSGKVPAGDALTTLVLPAQRKPGSTRMVVDVTPSMAVTMLDALPYLADYPYGCTEQTLSRFLPAVIVRKTLRDLGVDADAAMAHTFGGIETNFTAKTQPGGKRELSKLDDMVKAGLGRLYDFQHDDGGWGWWKDGNSDPWMTAYVVWGLKLATDAGVTIETERLLRGAEWIRTHLAESENDPVGQAWMLHALSHGYKPGDTKSSVLAKEVVTALENVLKKRENLTAYGRALFALSLDRYGRKDDALLLIRNLENGVVRNDAGKAVLGSAGTGGASVATVHWGRETGWYRWHDGAIETTAAVIRALLAIDPGNALVEPAVTWLQRNRRGAQWSNTRDTALAVFALNDYLRITGEGKPDLTYQVEVNGRVIGAANVSGKPLWEIRGRFAVPEEIVGATNTVRIVRKSGESPVYYAASAEFFSTEEPVAPAGNELFVRRDYFRLVPRETLLKGTVFDRVPLNDGGQVKSGERIEAVLTVETKNDYEYLMFEDLKPAGFEAVEIRSGESAVARQLRKFAVVKAPSSPRRDPTEYDDGSVYAHAEWRDRKAAFFVDRLGEGFWELRCEYRAETPGRFHALPVMAEAMYIPELRANGGETRLTVGE
jgi:uncharacterized protein YfaS (alpha-2-macroglobulin family)